MPTPRRSQVITALAVLALTLSACDGLADNLDIDDDLTEDAWVQGEVQSDNERSQHTPGADDEHLTADDEGTSFPSTTVDAELAALLDEQLTEELPGMVLFVGDREEAYLAAAGVSDRATATPLTTDAHFRIASVTKPMVAAAMLTFVDAGQIALDDPIADYLDRSVVAGLANAEHATLRQLLQMTSGIPDYLDTDAFWAAVEDDPRVFWTPQEVLGFAYGIPAEHAPGGGFSYSNSNYILIELIIAELTDQPLAEVLHDAVFTPAGMTDCFLETAERFATEIVRGYDLDDAGNLVDVTEVNDGVGLADGGVVCTAESLVRFLPALFDGEILSDDMLTAMLDATPSGSGSAYGLGIDVEADGEFGFTVGHDGASSGFQAALVYVVDEGISVAVLANSLAVDLPAYVVEDALDWWFDEEA